MDKVVSKKDAKSRKKAENLAWRAKLSASRSSADWDANPRHTLYYKKQLGLEPEWASFTQSLGTPLPAVFRLGGNCPKRMAKAVSRLCKTKFAKLEGRFVELSGVIVKDDIVSEVPYFLPAQRIWQCICDSSTLKNMPAFESLSDFLVREVSLGHIVRQELASMIPALLLDAQSHHRVLDCCAAPGSKTEQLLSMMSRNPGKGKGQSTGMVVANDADPVRINTLKERYDCTQNPSLLLTCAKAEDLATLLLQRTEGDILFDRIVADVPCSGDGTIRKFPHIYRLFRSRRSLDLHVIQLQIATASVRMLRRGGRMVYSTCSINPLEDEAVVCGLLRAFGKTRLRLIDTRKEGLLPSLRSRVGLSTWHTDEDTFLSGEKREELGESQERLPAVQPSMLPPSEEERSWMHLERCHRVLPHDMDCGGFFVAVLELIGEGNANKGNEEGKGKKGSEVDSTEIMKQLGYNPRRHKEGQGQGQGQSGGRTKRKREEGKAKEAALVHGVLEWATLEKEDGMVDRLGLQSLLPFNGPFNGSGAPRLVRERRITARDTQSQSLTAAKKKRGKGNGIFGSRAHGWSHATTEEEEEDGPMVEEEITLLSQEVHRAVLSWGQADSLKGSNVAIVKAGACLTTETGARLHDGASASLATALLAVTSAPAKKEAESNSKRVPLAVVMSVDLSDFMQIVKYGLTDSRGSSTNDLCEAVPRLQKWCEAADGTTATSKCLLVTLDDETSAGAATTTAPGEGETESKRRLSKAERKKSKGKPVQPPSSTATAATKREVPLDVELGASAPAVLVLEWSTGEGGSQLRVLSPRTKCESYRTMLTTCY